VALQSKAADYFLESHCKSKAAEIESRCSRKLPNISQRQVSAFKSTTACRHRKIRITRCENSRFYLELAKIRMKKSGSIEVFINKNI